MKSGIRQLIFLLSSFKVYSQQAIKDTVIDKITYHYATHYSNGKLNTLSQAKTKEQGGQWLFFDSNGNEMWSGQYNSKGKKDGDWWYKKKRSPIIRTGKRPGKKALALKGIFNESNPCVFNTSWQHFFAKCRYN